MDDYKISIINCDCGEEAMIIGNFGYCEKCARQHYAKREEPEKENPDTIKTAYGEFPEKERGREK